MSSTYDSGFSDLLNDSSKKKQSLINNPPLTDSSEKPKSVRNNPPLTDSSEKPKSVRNNPPLTTTSSISSTLFTPPPTTTDSKQPSEQQQLLSKVDTTTDKVKSGCCFSLRRGK